MKKPKLNITKQFVINKRKLLGYFAVRLTLFRWQLWMKYCACFFVGMIVAALIMSLIGWRVYIAMNTTTFDESEIQSANKSASEEVFQPERTTLAPTPFHYQSNFKAADFKLNGFVFENDYITPGGITGTATINFMVTTPGLYQFKADALGPNVGSNSFRLSVDGGDNYIWHWPGDNVRQKVYISHSKIPDDIAAIEKPLMIDFVQGWHTLILYKRENGAKLFGLQIEPVGFDVITWPPPPLEGLSITATYPSANKNIILVEIKNETDVEFQSGHHFFKAAGLDALPPTDTLNSLLPTGLFDDYELLSEQRILPGNVAQGLLSFSRPVTSSLYYYGTTPPMLVRVTQ